MKPIQTTAELIFQTVNLGSSSVMDNYTRDRVCSPPLSPPKSTSKQIDDIYTEVLPGLLVSVMDQMNDITVPMSESMFKMKNSMKDFIDQVHQHDDEIINHSSLDHVIQSVTILKSDILQVTEQTEVSFTLFGKKFQLLKDLIYSIFQHTGNISEIAERVHVLSINASIESARAGVHGRGFKVIAGEIQKLAHETQMFVKDIGGTVQNSRDIFSSIEGEINRNQVSLSSLEEKGQEAFHGLDEALSTQHSQFCELYSSILKFIDGFNGEIKAMAPMAMLHAISVQELENLQKITLDFLGILAGLHNEKKVVEATARPQDLINRIRERLTTSRELDVLEGAVVKMGLEGEIDLNRNQNAFELF